MNAVCVIGAGCAGLATARALSARGIGYDMFEAASALGGNWSHGVYDSTFLISSRDTSGFTEYPMPKHYPYFPSRVQMLEYIRAYADHFDLTKRVRFNEEVVSVRASEKPDAPWSVSTASGLQRDYMAVVVANGHLWDPVVPSVSGEFSGKQIHSRHYRNVNDIVGNKVLVVGAGNSGCDLVAEAAFAGKEVFLSLRRGHWFVPKTFFGIPRGELILGKLPLAVQRMVLKALAYVVLGDPQKRGLPKPDHRWLDEPPIINSLLFHLLDHGRVKVVPEIASFAGADVIFKDGSRAAVDTIMWATGYRTAFPFLEDGHLDWQEGVPLRIGGGVIAPRAPGLYFNGLASPRGGNLPMHSACAELIATCVSAQQALGSQFVIALNGERPTALMDAGVREIIDDAVRVGRRIEMQRTI